jgi:uncharacterized protein
MGERTQYTPGTFSWADLATPDQAAAKEFYAGLFGWDAVDMPVDENTVYSMMQIDGKHVAAIAPQPPQQRDAGVPPMWQNYVTVDSADAAVEKARELGANVHAPAFDVMEAGRMAVIADPQGAYFMVWEPNQHRGAQLVNGPGRLSWNELASPDVDGSSEFYAGLFGWKLSPMEGMPMRYSIISTAAGNSNGGIRDKMPDEPMPYWLAYFGTDDAAASLEKVRSGGGNVLMDVQDIGVGKIAIAQDPQGAVFALYGGRFDD